MMFSGLLAQAQGAAPITNPALGQILQSLLGQTSPGAAFLSAFLPMLITLVLTIAAVVFFFMLLWGGIEWILGGGDKANIEKARGRITNALVGIVLVLATFAILRLVETLFDITLTSFQIPSLNQSQTYPRQNYNAPIYQH